MKINQAGIDLIKKFEGCKLKAYRCPAKVWTIGYGHTKDVREGQKISQHQADVILASDLEVYAESVADLTAKLALTDNEFSALVSFAYNLGVTRLANSTLYKRLVKGDTAGAAAEFSKWTRAGGVVLPGLVKRREAEKALFLKP